MSKKKILSILIISLMVLGVVMFVVDSLQSRPAAGTCCKEDESICIVGSHEIHNYYLKGVGSCSEK